MAHRRESSALVRTPGASGVDRVHGVFLFHLFRLSADSRRGSLFRARSGSLLVGNDVFRDRLRFRLRHRDALSRREPVFHTGGAVAPRTYWWAVHGARHADRKIRARARRGVSFAARRRGHGRALGSLAASPLAILDLPPVCRVHVRVTVYVRNHYMADVLGGLVTGTLGYFLGCRLMKL